MPSKTAMKSWLEYWSHQLPTQSGQVYLFDRSWYSRALCQRTNKWATKKQVNYFLNAVKDFEKTRPAKILKLWLSIDANTQEYRLTRRIGCPLRGWKFSENDKNALLTYDTMSYAKLEMMKHSENWVEIDFNNKAQGEMNLLLQIYKFIIRENSYDNK
jgi:polyphosphate kinase 2 (PPK2 family)